MATSNSSSKKFSNHMDIADHKQVWIWLTMLQEKDPEGFVRLTGENLNRLQSIFGKAKWNVDDEPEWTHAWEITSNGLNFVITTGKKSTIYYVRTPTMGEEYISDPRIAVGIKEFMGHILEKLKETE